MKRALLCLIALLALPAQAKPDRTTGRLDVKNGSSYTAEIYIKDWETGIEGRIGVLSPGQQLHTHETRGHEYSLYVNYWTPRVSIYQYGPTYDQGKGFRWKVGSPMY